MKGGFFITRRQFPADDELLDKIYSGDESALNVLLNKYRFYSYKLINEYIRYNPEFEYLYDELHSLIFYSTHSLIYKFQTGRGVFYAYWKKSAYRLVEKYIEKNQKHYKKMSLDFTPSNAVRELHDIIGFEDKNFKIDLLNDSFMKIVNDPLNNFTPKEKETISYFLSGLEFKDIAELTNRNLSSVYKTYRKAVSKIGRVLRGSKK